MSNPLLVVFGHLKEQSDIFKCLKLIGGIVLLGGLLAPTPLFAAAHLVVSPNGPYTTVQGALDAAQEGDTIEVRGGIYPGNLVVDKSVVLEGLEQPALDAQGRGTVVTIIAPQVTLRGFVIENSGSDPDTDDAGITVNAPGAVIERNRLEEVLFGIFVAQGADTVIRGNDVTSQARFDSGRKGDGIRLWYSPRVRVENNHIHGTRDVVVWYSEGVRILNNHIEQGRYGVHLMYCDNARIENNRLHNNSVGIYSMYSKKVELRGNDLRGQRGPSGYALGFKDTDDVVAEGNLLADNRGGIFLDGTPFNPKSTARFEDNALAFNDIAVTLMPAVKGVIFSANSFWENVEQMTVNGGGGKADANAWRGNYWSDYEGLDTNGDEIGDTPYTPAKFFESMTDREPILRALLYSPSAQAIEFAASAFPLVKPLPKFSDPQPRVTPPALPVQSPASTDSRGGMLGIAAVLLGGVAAALVLAHGGQIMEFRHQVKTAREALPQARTPAATQPLMLNAKAVSKHYGGNAVLEDVSFEMEAASALALWGPNGVGKTTLMKAMLGLIGFEGSIEIGNLPVKQGAKRVRTLVGYVPQEVSFYDWSVRATLEFYAHLKRVPTGRIPLLAEQLGLDLHLSKPVAALSGGLKQRLALALALLADPPILLLDEPTANLDPQARADYIKLIAEVKRKGKTIVFASHRAEEVQALADTVLWLVPDKPARTMKLEEWHTLVAPLVELTLWLPEAERTPAAQFLNERGYPAHLNGRGTVVIRTRAQFKLKALQDLHAEGFVVDDFEVER